MLALSMMKKKNELIRLPSECEANIAHVPG